MEIATISDGACHLNKICGIGIVILDTKTKKIIAKHSENVGDGNVVDAEYKAFIKGIEMVIELLKENDIKKVYFFCDSLLLISQVKGTWRVKAPYIAEYVEKIQSLLEKVNKKIKNVVIDHVPREFTHKADELASKALKIEHKRLVSEKYAFLDKKN